MQFKNTKSSSTIYEIILKLHASPDYMYTCRSKFPRAFQCAFWKVGRDYLNLVSTRVLKLEGGYFEG